MHKGKKLVILFFGVFFLGITQSVLGQNCNILPSYPPQTPFPLQTGITTKVSCDSGCDPGTTDFNIIKNGQNYAGNEISIDYNADSTKPYAYITPYTEFNENDGFELKINNGNPCYTKELESTFFPGSPQSPISLRVEDVNGAYSGTNGIIDPKFYVDFSEIYDNAVTPYIVMAYYLKRIENGQVEYIVDCSVGVSAVEGQQIDLSNAQRNGVPQQTCINNAIGQILQQLEDCESDPGCLSNLIDPILQNCSDQCPNNFPLTIDSSFAAGTYILGGKISYSGQPAFDVNSPEISTEQITIISRQTPIFNIPETNPFLVVLIALSVIMLAKNKKMSRKALKKPQKAKPLKKAKNT